MVVFADIHSIWSKCCRKSYTDFLWKQPLFGVLNGRKFNIICWKITNYSSLTHHWWQLWLIVFSLRKWHKDQIKAIGGVRVKKSMLGLFERSPWGGTEAFYGMSILIFVQKLSHFEVRDFGRISYKKMDKIDILRYFTPNVSAPSIFVQISWNLHQMTTPYRWTKLRELF